MNDIPRARAHESTEEILADALKLFRQYEKHHRSEAFRLHCGSPEHQDRMAKSETNRVMADRIEQFISAKATKQETD